MRRWVCTRQPLVSFLERANWKDAMLVFVEGESSTVVVVNVGALLLAHKGIPFPRSCWRTPFILSKSDTLVLRC